MSDDTKFDANWNSVITRNKKTNDELVIKVCEEEKESKIGLKSLTIISNQSGLNCETQEVNMGLHSKYPVRRPLTCVK